MTNVGRAFIALLLALLFVFSVVTDYRGRVAIVQSQRDQCEAGIDQRLQTSEVWRQQERAARRIADDPFQSARTRSARIDEARTLRDARRVLRPRLDPKHGGALVCSEAYPEPALLTLSTAAR